MKNNNKIILNSIFVTIIIITILSAFIYNKIEFIFEPKYSKNDVVTEYKKNKPLFLQSINELLQEENICFNKNDNSISIQKYCYDKEKQINISSAFEKKKYANTLKIMNNNMIKRVTKNDENIEFAISSRYGLDQYIVYLKNKENYYFDKNIIRKLKIDDLIYYIEAD